MMMTVHTFPIHPFPSTLIKLKSSDVIGGGGGGGEGTVVFFMIREVVDLSAGLLVGISVAHVN